MHTLSQARVLVVGGGYAGILAAARIARGGRAQVTLIDQRATFTQRIRLHEAIAGTRVPGFAYGPALARRGVAFLQARVEGIDQARQELLLAGAGGGARRLGYDLLLVALGSSTPAGAPGVADHAVRLNDPDVAARSATQLKAAAAAGGRALVVGGGLTAIEAAAELAARLPGLRVTMAAGGSIGADYSQAGARHLKATLERLGVELREGARVVALEAGSAQLAGGEALRYDSCIWAGGFAAPALLGEAGLPVDGLGRVLVTPTLQAHGNPTIYVAGDSAAAGDDRRSIRMGCAAAMPMGVQAGENIAATLAGQAPQPHNFGFFLRCVSLGRHDGLVQFTDSDDRPAERILSGMPAATVKELICRMTLESLRGELRTGLPLYRWPGGGSWWATAAAAA